MADGVPLKDGKTNPTQNTQVIASVVAQPMIFLRVDTGEVIVVPKQDTAALRSHHMSLSDCVAEMQSANRAVFYTNQMRIDLALRSVGGRPADPQAMASINQACDWAYQWLKEAQNKLDKAYEGLDKVNSGGEKLVELISLVEKKEGKSKTTTETASLDFSNDGAKIKAKIGSFKSAAQMREGLKYPKMPSEKIYYVQKSRVKPVWPKFKEEGATKWDEVLVKGANGKRHLDQTKLKQYGKDQLKKAKVTGGDFLEALGYEKLELECSGTLVDWADKWNQKLNWSKDSKWSIGGAQLTDVSLSSEAALMRYSAGSGLNATFEPFKRGVSLKAEGNAQVSLAEGRAQALLYFPAEDGLLLYFDTNGFHFDMGAIRLTTSLTLSGSVGASLTAEIGVSVEGKQQEPLHIIGKRKKPLAERPSAFAVNKSQPVVDAGAELKCFAGLKADVELKGSLDWRDPEDKKKAFKEIASIAPSVGGMVGLAGEFKFKVEYTDGTFRITAHAGLCFGAGAAGAVTLAVNLLQITMFQKCFYYQLASLEFHFTEIFAATAFTAMRDLCFLAIQTGEQIGKLLQNRATDITVLARSVVRSFEKADQRVDLAKKVLADPVSLRYSPPETKGMLLYLLSRHSYADYVSQGGLGEYYLQSQRQAALHILKWAQTRREIDNIIQHVGPLGEKGDVRKNYQDLHNFFRTEGPADIDLPLTSSPYDKEFKTIYQRAPADITAMNGDFSVWFNQLYGFLRETPARGYGIARADTAEYALNKDQADHTMFASIGDQAYYSNQA